MKSTLALPDGKRSWQLLPLVPPLLVTAQGWILVRTRTLIQGRNNCFKFSKLLLPLKTKSALRCNVPPGAV